MKKSHLSLAILVMLVLMVAAAGTVSAAPRQQTIDICSRTAEVQTAILAELSGATTCSTVSAAQLSGITYLRVTGYSNSTIIPGDFAGLTALDELNIVDSPILTTTPANAFSEVSSTLTTLFLAGTGTSIETLHKDTFDGLAAVTWLNLDSNNLTSLDPDLFDGLPSLVTVSLIGNYLRDLEPGLFDDSPGLRRISLNHNLFTEIGEDTFSGLTSLERISLFNNRVTTIHQDAFDGLDSLRYIDLRGNNIRSLDQDIFDGLTSLRQLYLTQNQLTSIHRDTFDGLTSLWDLRLNQNSISSLHRDTFDGLTSLDWLLLQDNNLTSLDGDLFDGLTALNRLYIQRNRLASIPGDTFDELTSLALLALSDNELQTLPPGLFTELTALTHLYLHNNNIASLHEDIFSTMTGLDTLSLGSNNLSTMDEDIFDDLSNLRVLSLYDNGLTSPDEDLFDGLSSLQTLDLQENGLASPDEDLFDGLSSLRSLRLQDNGLTSPHENLFDGLSSLRTLELQDNGLVSPHADLFDGLGNLDTLDLSGNSMTALTAGMFDDLDDSLKTLRLQSNALTGLTAGIFTGLTGMEELDLSCNQIATLDLNEFNPFAASLSYLDISGNSFTTPPTVTALRNKLTNANLRLFTGTNTACQPPTDIGIREIRISNGIISPEFEPPGANDTYGLVDNEVTRTTITIIANDPDATVEERTGNQFTIYDDDPNTPGWQVKLPGRMNVFNWIVRSKNGKETETYTLHVFRAPPAPVTFSRTSLTINEGGSDAYTIKLDTEPTAAVTISISAGGDVTTQPTSLLFTPTNWGMPQTVTVSAGNDDDASDDTVTITHTVTSDSAAEYAVFTILPDVHVTVLDDEVHHQVKTLRTLVANTGSGNNQAQIITTFAIDRWAQGFTTGIAGGGYVLGSVGLRLSTTDSNASPGDLEVTINQVAANGHPGDALCTLNNPASLQQLTVNAFTAPTAGDGRCPALKPNTKYFVVIKRISGTPAIRLTKTSRNGEDSGHAARGWSIGDSSQYAQAGSTVWLSDVNALKLDIEGDYVPALTVIDASADESGDPDTSTTMTFQIFLDQKVKHSVSVDYATQDGTAEAGVNYTHTSGTVTFAPREQVKTVDVDILEDNRGGSTYFMLVLSNPKRAGLRANHPGTGRILDTLPLFRTWDASASEGNTPISFVVEFNHREPGDTADYTVDYRTEDITATAGADYVSTSGTLTFTPADGDLVVPVTIKDDDIQDNGETFRLVLSNPSSGVTLHRTAATAIGTILNHDSEGLTATFPASAYASKSHKGPTDRPQVVVAFNSSVASISTTTPSVVVNGGSITSVQAHTEDGLQNAQIFFLEPDGNDDITFTLVANVACASGGICSGTGTPITQVPSAHTIPAKQTPTISQLSVADATASEEDDSTINFVVTLNPASDESVTVDYATANGSAAAGDDYTAKSGSLTFNAGDTTKTIQVSIIDDTVDDNNETLTITLSNASGAEISDGQATGTITNIEPQALTAAFKSMPDSHDGDTAFTFQVQFSENVAISKGDFKDFAFTISNGDVTSAERVDGNSDLWTVTLDPDGNDDVTVALPGNRDCDTLGAVCTPGTNPRQLTNDLSATVAGPAEDTSSDTTEDTSDDSTEETTADPLTASFSNVPDSHDGSAAFTFQVLFSEDVGISYVNMRDHAFSLSDGDVTGARRVEGRSDLWEITVDPDDNSDVVITLPANRSCTTAGAICTREDTPRQLTNSPTATVTGPAEAPPTNTSAAGAPTISGTPQVEQTLAADTSSITDEDGLDNVSYSYQWIAGGTDIEGATGSSYTLTASEQGKTIQVKVTFTDDADNGESLTSVATDPVAAVEQANNAATGLPSISGTAQVGETLTANTSNIDDQNGLDNVSYSYQWVRNDGTDDTDIAGETSSTYTLVDADQGQTIRVKVTFTDDADNDESLTSVATVAVLARPNRAAAGLPTISGTPQVAQTLTADTSGISDEDGLSNVSYTYQWIAGGADIDGATGASYTLTADEEGLAIQVWVSFEDDAGHPETLTSAATLAVAPKPIPLTATFSNMPTSHDGSTEFTFELTFSENFPLSYATLRDHAFTEDDNGPITKAQRKVQGSNQTWTITVDPKGNGTITITLPETTDCNADGAICTDDGRKLSNSTTVTVSGPE